MAYPLNREWFRCRGRGKCDAVAFGGSFVRISENRLVKKLSHLDSHGNARMVGVTHKADVPRQAMAVAFITLSPATIRLLKKDALPKGDVLTVAKIAGIQAAKQTSALIPLCHPLSLHRIDVNFVVQRNGISIFAEAETIAKTGVEMEALTAASMAALTIYDMCKAVDKTMTFSVSLTRKTKGVVS